MARQRERGATAVEAAVVLSTYLLIVVGILWFGLTFSVYQSIVTAAREGARYGVAPLASSSYSLPTSNQIAQRSCNYLRAAVFGGLNQCINYGNSTPPAITGCTDTTLTSGPDNIYVGFVSVPYTVKYVGGSQTATFNQTQVVVGIRKTVPVLGFTLHLTTCSSMRSENN